MLIKLEISHFSLFIVYIMFVVWHIYHVNIYKLSFSRFLHPTKTAIFEEIFSKNIFWKSVKKIFFIGYFHGLLNNMLIFLMCLKYWYDFSDLIQQVSGRVNINIRFKKYWKFSSEKIWIIHFSVFCHVFKCFYSPLNTNLLFIRLYFHLKMSRI